MRDFISFKATRYRSLCYKSLQYLCMRFASTLVMLPNLNVQLTHHLLMVLGDGA